MCVFIAGATKMGLLKSQALITQVRRLSQSPWAWVGETTSNSQMKSAGEGFAGSLQSEGNPGTAKGATEPAAPSSPWYWR